jgi:hypothetical protein
MSSIALNPYQPIQYVQANLAQNAAQAAVNNQAAAQVASIARPVSNLTNQAVASTSQGDAQKGARGRETSNRSTDGASTRVDAEFQGQAAARGGRRPGAQLNILV